MLWVVSPSGDPISLCDNLAPGMVTAMQNELALIERAWSQLNILQIDIMCMINAAA
jgi:hypothetical protein